MKYTALVEKHAPTPADAQHGLAILDPFTQETFLLDQLTGFRTQQRQKFLQNNGAFLTGITPATVYSVPAEELNRPEQQRKQKSAVENYNSSDAAAKKSVAKPKSAPAAQDKDESSPSAQMRNVAPQR